ncbi:hypothetical protein HY605_02960 [Candidatus Peregrinibacteria bacterium]|nr:hypothetical protein [Candidatus Peregrinibacteria bacterium]
MGVRTKTLITVILVTAVVAILTLQTTNSSLFKGQLSKQDPSAGTQEESISFGDDALPDLSVDLAILAPEQAGGDLSTEVTITNLGPGAINGDQSFKYTIYLNDEEIFSNVDSYTIMEAGDSFSFSYPVSRLIYEYPDAGSAKVVIDSEDSVEEDNEENNEKQVKYFL